MTTKPKTPEMSPADADRPSLSIKILRAQDLLSNACSTVEVLWTAVANVEQGDDLQVVAGIAINKIKEATAMLDACRHRSSDAETTAAAH